MAIRRTVEEKTGFQLAVETLSDVAYTIKRLGIENTTELDQIVCVAEEIRQILFSKCITQSGHTSSDIIEKVFSEEENTRVSGYISLDIARTITFTTGTIIDVRVTVEVDRETLKASVKPTIDITRNDETAYNVNLFMLGSIANMLADTDFSNL